jgi:2-polyprenyl-6-hydroxyphenyl methylase/3-demethylubiquinone-9 3-methyltransferase
MRFMISARIPTEKLATAAVAGIVGRGARSALSAFLAYNWALSARIEPHLPHAKPRVGSLYAETVARYLASEGDQLVVDVGGGRKNHYAGYKRSGANTRIIAVDISEEALRKNCDVDDKILADAASSLPFDDAQVDLITSRFLLEHLRTIDGFLRESARALQAGGYSIHVFPSRYAPFALINRALPDKLARRLLHSVRPNTKAGSGFPAYYDRCYYSAVEKLLQENGLEVIEARFSYYQSQYFKGFLPLYLASVSYELLLRAVGAKNLCPYAVIVARKS